MGITGSIIVTVVGILAGYLAALTQHFLSKRTEVREVLAALFFEIESNRRWAQQYIKREDPGNYLRDEAWVHMKNIGYIAYLRTPDLSVQIMDTYDALHRLNQQIKNPVNEASKRAVSLFEENAQALAENIYNSMGRFAKRPFGPPAPWASLVTSE